MKIRMFGLMMFFGVLMVQYFGSLNADLAICCVDVKRNCNSPPLTGTCAGACGNAYVYCGNGVQYLDEQYDFIVPPPGFAFGTDLAVEQASKKCGTVYDCYCEINIGQGNRICRLVFVNPQDYMMGQYKAGGVPCFEDPLDP